jgi:hypothetical protein
MIRQALLDTALFCIMAYVVIYVFMALPGA